MQVTSTKYQNPPLALIHTHKQQAKNLPVPAEGGLLNTLARYLLSLPCMAFTVKVVRLVFQVFAFILSVLTGKKLSKSQKVEQKRIVHVEKEARTESEIGKQEKQLQDHFLVMAAHELKTPMTTILGQVQLVLRRLSRMPELSAEMRMMRTALESIDGQTRRLNTLVDDLLDLYNVRAGKIQLHLAICDLVELCNEVVKEHQLLTGRTIELEAPQASILLEADSERLRQTMINLISNAVKYSRNETPVKVLIDQRRDIGVIEVIDAGMGIPTDQQTHIFEPFYRCPDVEASSMSGLGLGLAICKDIVERHAGRIWCRSRVGKGSTFIVELPLKKSGTRKLS